jgi:hypothetical protein
MILDVLGKLYYQDPIIGRAAGIPFLLFAQRFLENAPVQEYCFRFAKYGVDTIGENELAMGP